LESKTVKQQQLPVSNKPHTMTIEPNNSDGDNNIDPLDQYMLDYNSNDKTTMITRKNENTLITNIYDNYFLNKQY